MKIIELTISPEGVTTLKVNGVSGASCKDLTKQLSAKLGNVTDSNNTDDYYKEDRIGQEVGR